MSMVKVFAGGCRERFRTAGVLEKALETASNFYIMSRNDWQ